jgi:hypothetical protein
MSTSRGAGLVLSVLAASRFLTVLGSPVMMNVSMAQVAEDLDTPITGIQTATTVYMARRRGRGTSCSGRRTRSAP